MKIRKKIHLFRLVFCWLIIPIALVSAPGCGGDDPETGARVEQSSTDARERELIAVREAAVQYFEAEIRRDHKAIYNMLAPDSRFRRAYTEEQYLLFADEEATSIKKYQIQDVGPVGRDVDRETYPDIELTAPVKVAIGVYDGQTGEITDRTTVFVFVRQDGIWYKG